MWCRKSTGPRLRRRVAWDQCGSSCGNCAVGAQCGALGRAGSRLLAAIESQGLGDHDLVDLAYTLQVGREAMEVRLGLTAASLDELKAKLHQYVAGAAHIEELYLGEVKRNKEALSVFAADEDMAKTLG